MKSRSLKLALILSLLFNFSIIAAVGYFFIKESGCRVSPDRPAKRHAALAEKLDLSPEQKKVIAESDARFRNDIEGARKELVAKRERLFTLLKEDMPDRAAIGTVISDISALQGRIEGHVVEHILNEKAALNKEQQEAYLKLLEKRFNKVRSHRAMRPGLLAPGR
ncbi:MAG: periplasmic heavy metal sensor [Deltaproteobacteria bacterium]|nr:periplasmic heavy metal sensor [Deltaproteobacteria bacterium]